MLTRAPRPIHLINLHSASRMLADTLMTTFGIAYFFTHGIALPVVFCVYAVTQGLRILIRERVVDLGYRIGLRSSLIVSTILVAGIYPLIAQVQGITAWLFVFIVYKSIVDTAYFTNFHTYFSILSSCGAEDVGAKEIALTVSRALAPIVGSLGIVYGGYGISLWIASGIVLLGTLPLLALPDIPHPPLLDWRVAWTRLDKRGFWAHLGHGWAEVASRDLYPFMLFLAFRDYIVVGELSSYIIVMQILLLALLGRLVRVGYGRISSYVAIASLATVILGRIAFGTDMTAILVFNAVYAFGICIYNICLDTLLYGLAGESESPWQFQAFAESGCDVGAAIGWIFGAGVVWMGLDLRVFLAWGLGGLIVLMVVFLRYYGVREGTPVSDVA